MQTLLREGSLAEMMQLIKSFAREVEVVDGQVILGYTMAVGAPGSQRNKEVSVLAIESSGGAGGTRTPYLFNAIEALSQLSYSPTKRAARWPRRVRIL
jgi:hypothetical protein